MHLEFSKPLLTKQYCRLVKAWIQATSGLSVDRRVMQINKHIQYCPTVQSID